MALWVCGRGREAGAGEDVGVKQRNKKWGQGRVEGPQRDRRGQEPRCGLWANQGWMRASWNALVVRTTDERWQLELCVQTTPACRGAQLDVALLHGLHC